MTVLLCSHQWLPVYPHQTIYHKDHTEEIPGLSRCDRCHTNWKDDGPEPRVVIGTIE